jgi:hypothetical protein
MRALNEAVTAAFPDAPDEMYTAALGFGLATLFFSLDQAERPSASILSIFS